MRTADVCPTCSTFTNALCVIFDGPLLTTLDINPLDSLDVALTKIEAFAIAGVPGSSIIIQDEGSLVLAAAATLNFVGGGVTATDAGSNITTVTIPESIKIDQSSPQTIINGAPIFSNGINTNYLVVDVGGASSGDPGSMDWNADEDTMNLHANGISYQLGQEMAPLVRNTTGSTIPNGTPVMFGGTIGGSGRILVIPAIADGSIPSSYILGILTEDIANNADGHTTSFGKVRDVDTSGTPYSQTWADGDILYVDINTPGYLTNVKPSAPSPQIFMGVVINAHVTNGTIFVRPSWRGLLTDLDNVSGVEPTVTGQIITWNNSAKVFDFTSNISDFLIPKTLVDDTTVAYELILSDANNTVTMNNAGANTLTIPANGAVLFPIGTEIVLINKGVGVTTVAITTDTLNQNIGGLTMAQYDKRVLIKITATSWILGN